jgi:nitroimidazol reductase NimA-like FMN-containing flavoprotein (pyridoxamine 5'-phosphate oxidase superfamily)
MRRKEKEITEQASMEEIIKRSSICRLAMADESGNPYVIPLCFGYRGNTVYLHSAREGRKIDILKNNPRVCVLFDIDQEVLPGKEACEWGMRFQSVIAFGTASFLEKKEEKHDALNIIMDNYSNGNEAWRYPKKAMDAVLIIKIHVEEMTGKVSGQP